MMDEKNGRLVSWKEIAAYLGCDVRTCLRWEKERGLPVHWSGGKPGPRVMAWKKELDQWLAGPFFVQDHIAALIRRRALITRTSIP
jgi:predicted DNA-binding transcriptional regulator AlpA